MIKGLQKKYLELGKISKFHTLAQSWSKCMTCISLDPVFDLATLCDVSMPLFHTYPKLHKKSFRGRMKIRQISKAFGEDYTHWVIEWIVLRSKAKSNKTQVSEQSVVRGFESKLFHYSITQDNVVDT
jgi:hypothetical protein